MLHGTFGDKTGSIRTHAGFCSKTWYVLKRTALAVESVLSAPDSVLSDIFTVLF